LALSKRGTRWELLQHVSACVNALGPSIELIKPSEKTTSRPVAPTGCYQPVCLYAAIFFGQKCLALYLMPTRP
jgi:hypothetical protein